MAYKNVQNVEVTEQEAGQKLINYLLRRLNREVPYSALMRCIRKGQVRINSKRVGPFHRVQHGNTVRIPPFHIEDAPSAEPCPPKALTRIYESDDVVVLHKPAGLPTHAGTGHTDSLAERLRAEYPSAPFTPTPAHRLDKAVSGLLIAAKSYTALQNLHERFKTNRIHKYYLALTSNPWSYDSPQVFSDQLAKTKHNGKETIEPKDGKEAVSLITRIPFFGPGFLLLVRIITGRMHQIRVQLSSRGLPIIGDTKYSGPASERLMLHSVRMVLPDAGVGFPESVFLSPDNVEEFQWNISEHDILKPAAELDSLLEKSRMEGDS